MTGSDWAVIVVAVISLVGALLSARSARGAAKYNAEASHASARAEAETEAYNRARKMDVETIHRQDEEIKELIADNKKLRDDLKTLKADHDKLWGRYREQHEELQTLRRHVARLSEESEKDDG